MQAGEPPEAGTLDVFEELFSVVDAITERVKPDEC
jgi:hypothetical protein